MIIDETQITIQAGNGGDGHVSFRREKYVPNGGPDGGDGGKGGDIYFRANPSLNTLTNFASTRHYHAEDGKPGGTSQKSGHSGEDMYLDVPPGTIIFNTVTNNKLADIVEISKNIRIAKGGRGGWGNIHFKSSINQAPQEFNPGVPGEKFTLRLELKMIADVGLIGFPNAGKSTLISHISKATPKIADYPFTTLEPNLGVAKYHDHTFVVADIPGLIEGASEGRGLGHKFLKHVERTKILAHLIDINEPDILKSYKIIRKELEKYSPTLASKSEIIIINKIDITSTEDLAKIMKKLKSKLKDKVIIPLSAVSGKGIEEFLRACLVTILGSNQNSFEAKNSKREES